MRPLLLLDVDGVLMPTGRSLPQGYRRVQNDEFDVVVSDQHGLWLRSLVPLFDLAWATTWGDSAAETFGRLLELPSMPVVPLGDLRRRGTRKLPAVATYVGDRPLAWVDDELYEDAEDWAAGRAAPTLLVKPRASVGLSQKDVEAIVRFGELLGRGSGGHA